MLGSFIDLIMHGRLRHNDYGPDPSGHPAGVRWMRLIMFMQKWDCEGPLRTFALCVTELLLCGRVSPHHAFIFGMLADEEELCISALKVKGKAVRPLLVSDVPFPAWQRVGVKYMYALASAQCGAGHGKEWTDISDAFRRHLVQAEKAVDNE